MTEKERPAARDKEWQAALNCDIQTIRPQTTNLQFNLKMYGLHHITIQVHRFRHPYTLCRICLG